MCVCICSLQYKELNPGMLYALNNIPRALSILRKGLSSCQASQLCDPPASVTENFWNYRPQPPCSAQTEREREKNTY